MAKKKEELSPIEKERLQRALSDYEGASNLDIINKDPEYFYFLAAKDEKYPTHPQNVSSLENIGYEVVNTENNSGEILPHGTVKTADGGAIQNQELVLMRLPKWLRDARQKRSDDDAITRADNDQEQFREAMERAAQDSGQDVTLFRNERSRERY